MKYHYTLEHRWEYWDGKSWRESIINRYNFSKSMVIEHFKKTGVEVVLPIEIVDG